MAGFSVTSPKEKLTSRVDRTRFAYFTPFIPPLSYWTVERVRAALAMHDQGDFSLSGLLIEQLTRNSRISGALATRSNAVLGLPFQFDKAEHRRGARAQRTIADAPEWWTNVPESTLADLLRWFVLMGFAIAEVVWTTTPETWWPTLVPVHPSLCGWDETRKCFTVQTATSIEYVTPGTGKFLVMRQSRTMPWTLGAVRCLGIPDSIRNYAVRDWARWSEKHGLPIIKAKVPNAESEEDDAAFGNSLANLGNESTLILPQVPADSGPSFDAEYMEPKNRSWDGFEALIKLTSSDISIAILGQNLSTEVTGGSLAAATAHEQVRRDYVEFDAGMLSVTIRNDVLLPWSLYNFGTTEAAPWPVWDSTPPEDLTAKATRQKTAAEALAKLREIGIVINEFAYLEAYGFPLLPNGITQATPQPATST